MHRLVLPIALMLLQDPNGRSGGVSSLPPPSLQSNFFFRGVSTTVRLDRQNILWTENYVLTVSGKPHPAAILVHREDQSAVGNMFSLAKTLLSAGYSVFLVRDRPLAPATIDDRIEDIQRCVRLIRASAEMYDIDPNRIALIGDEGGGYLASSAALRPPVDQGRGARWRRASDQVQAVVTLISVGAFGKNAISPRGDSSADVRFPISDTVTPSFGINLPSAARASAPPFLVIEGPAAEGDPTAGAKSDPLIETLKAAGSRTDLIRISDKQPAIPAYPVQSSEWQRAMIYWLDSTLGVQKPGP